MPRTAWITAAFVLALLWAPGSAGAAVFKSWDGGGPTDTWNTGANWSPDGVPGPGDTVFTGNDEGLEITLDSADANVAQVTGGASLVIDGRSLILTGGASTESALPSGPPVMASDVPSITSFAPPKIRETLAAVPLRVITRPSLAPPV
jgi:hypothetical protein